MNICIFSEMPFLLNRGGLESYTYWVAAQLAQRGHHVLCVTTMQGNFRPPPGTDVAVLPVMRPLAEQQLSELLRRHHIELFWMHMVREQWVNRCHSLCRECGAKMVYHLHINPHSAMEGYTDCLAETWFDCCRGRRIPAFFYAFLRYPLCYLKRYFGERRRFHSIYEKVDAFVLLSERYREPFMRIAGLGQAPKVYALSNPLLLSPCVALPEKQKELLYVGRLPWQHKRVDRLLKAWHLLERDFPDWRLTIVGEGPAQARYEELTAELGLQHVVFEGRQSPEAFYARASIFCMTSTFEGFPLVLPEAQAAGCVPVVFDSYAAVHDIIENGVNGCLVRPFRLHLYAAALRGLMSNAARRAAMAEAAQQSVRRFSAEKNLDACETLFTSLLEVTLEHE